MNVNALNAWLCISSEPWENTGVLILAEPFAQFAIANMYSISTTCAKSDWLRIDDSRAKRKYFRESLPSLYATSLDSSHDCFSLANFGSKNWRGENETVYVITITMITVARTNDPRGDETARKDKEMHKQIRESSKKPSGQVSRGHLNQRTFHFRPRLLSKT